jgi:protein SCO1/2
MQLAALVFLLAALSVRCAMAAPEPPPAHVHESMPIAAVSSDSLYQLPVRLTTSAGEAMELSSLRGRPLLVTMFYSRCTSVCPILTMTLQRLDGKLSVVEQSDLRVLMVSLDAAHETPATLAAFAEEHHVDPSRWIVARASGADVRALAGALGIRYRALPDGTFNHSTVISLLDREGVIRASSTTLTGVDEDFLGAVRKTVNARSDKAQ